MFLANSLKERLKKNYLENNPEYFGKESSNYNPPPRNLKVLLHFKGLNHGLPPYPSEEMTSQQLRALDKKEWEQRFSPSNLKQEWENRVQLNFQRHHKKFSDDIVPPQTRIAKEYVNELIDADILELKQKRWNISTDAQSKARPELKKTLFDVNHGLNDFQVVPLKEKCCPEGCDSRDQWIINGNKWQVSTKLEQTEKDIRLDETKQKASDNTIRYWKKNDFDRKHENPFPITEERKKLEIVRYFQKYRTPYQKYYDHYNTMNKVKTLTNDEYSSVKENVLYNNPGCKYPEKINALIFKNMFNTYRNKYNEITGKIDKETIKKNQDKENKFHWKDDDLIDKIISVGSINDTTWFKPRYLNKERKNISKSQENIIHKEMLKCLVIKGNDIHKKEEEIKEQKEEEIKKQQKKEWLLKQKSCKGRSLRKNKSNLMLSKYPINKTLYEKLPILLHSYSQKEISENAATQINCKTALLNPTNENDDNQIKQTEDTKLFLDAYKDIAEKEVNKENIRYQKEQEDMVFHYIHPGTYRMFEFKENVYEGKERETDFEEKKTTKIVKVNLWSCCMNEKYLSRGCQRVGAKKYQWYYDQPI